MTNQYPEPRPAAPDGPPPATPSHRPPTTSLPAPLTTASRVRSRPPLRRLLAVAGALILTTTMTTLPAVLGAPAHADTLPDHCAQTGPTEVTCAYTDTGEHEFTVPAGVTAVTVDAVGGHGGAGSGDGVHFVPGGFGARLTDVPLTIPAHTDSLWIEVAGNGQDADPRTGAGSHGGGGGGGAGRGGGGGGGGASTVQTRRTDGCVVSGDPADDCRLVVVGGGGGELSGLVGGGSARTGGTGDETAPSGHGGDSGGFGSPGGDGGYSLDSPDERSFGGGAGDDVAGGGGGGSLHNRHAVGGGGGGITGGGWASGGTANGAAGTGGTSDAGGGGGWFGGGAGSVSGGGGAGSSYVKDRITAGLAEGAVTDAVAGDGTALAPSVTIRYTLPVVTAPLVVTTINLPDATQGQPYPATGLTATGGTGVPYAWAATGLPAGLVLDPATGVITGTPTGPAGPTNTAQVTVTATDSAGHTATATLPLRILYAFGGFQNPITTGTGDINLIKAGQAVPVKFSLHGYQGTNILATTPTPTSHACGTDPLPADITAETSASNGLTYNPLTDTYTYIWKTPKNAAGCATLTLRLNDTTTHTAEFQYK